LLLYPINETFGEDAITLYSRELQIRVPKTQLAFHPHAPRTAVHHRDVRQQQRLCGYKQQLTKWASKHNV